MLEATWRNVDPNLYAVLDVLDVISWMVDWCCCSASDAARGVVGGVNEGASTSSMPGPSRAVSPSATPADDEASSANPTGDTSTHWTREQTMLLLSLCQDFKDDLNDPSKRKKTTWQRIAQSMLDKGYTVTWILVEKKLRNLKATYRNIIDNVNQTGRGRITWEFFEQMHKLYGKDPTVTHVNVVESAETVATAAVGDEPPESEELLETATEATPQRSKGSKRKRSSDTLSVMVKELKEVEERKISMFENLTQAVVDSNKERTEALHQMNDTMKKLLEKF